MTNIISETTKNYDPERLARAIQRAVIANLTPAGDAENFARRVVEKVERWLTDKSEVTNRELRLQTASALTDYDPDAAYFYENENKLF